MFIEIIDVILNILSIFFWALCAYLFYAFIGSSYHISKHTILVSTVTISSFLIFIVMYSNQIEEKIGSTALNTSFGLGILLPVLSLILTYLAIRGIKKDQELLRSIDRIR